MVFQANIQKSWGYHSRFIERLVHPEDELIFKGYSNPVFQNLPVGSFLQEKNTSYLCLIFSMAYGV